MSKVTFDYSKAGCFIADHEVEAMKVLAEDCRYREIKYYADGDFKKWLEQEEPDANKDRYFLFSPKASESR